MFVSKKRLENFINDYLYTKNYKHRIAELERKIEHLEGIVYNPKVTLYQLNSLGQTVMEDVRLIDFTDLLMKYLGIEYKKPTETKGKFIKVKK